MASACLHAPDMLGPLLLLKARENTSMPHIGVFSMATSDYHGCLHLQVVLRRQGQDWVRVGRQGQQPSPAQLNEGPGSTMPSASRTGLPRGDCTSKAGGLSRCCSLPI